MPIDLPVYADLPGGRRTVGRVELPTHFEPVPGAALTEIRVVVGQPRIEVDLADVPAGTELYVEINGQRVVAGAAAGGA